MQQTTWCEEMKKTTMTGKIGKTDGFCNFICDSKGSTDQFECSLWLVGYTTGSLTDHSEEWGGGCGFLEQKYIGTACKWMIMLKFGR